MNKAKDIKHESGELHASGKATFVDDMPTPENMLYGLVVCSPVASGSLTSFKLEKAKKTEGVKAVLSFRDIAGRNQMGPIIQDEPILVEEEINFVGQAMFLIAAQSPEIARKAAGLISYSIQETEPVISLEEAMKQNQLLREPKKIERGDCEKIFNTATHILTGALKTGAQEHWYLETQISLAIPGDGDEIKIFSSTQHPSEVQEIVAQALNWKKMQVEVEARRLGGAFGGKETQANHVAVWSSLLAWHTKRPVKINLHRDDDQKMTGKRHPMIANYKVAFDEKGLIQAVDFDLNLNAGAFVDLSFAILERAMFHVDNAYYLPAVRIIGKAYKTNLPPNTAFRGFGGPQGMAVIETIIDRIARLLKKDAAEIRHINFYKPSEKNITPYGQIIENNRLPILWEQLTESSVYFERRKAIDTFNAANKYRKRGMALTPIKFGISFTASFLNQAGALVNIYKDGSVLVNHGGIEMGQGLHTKIAQVASAELGVNISRIKVNATNTSKVPNTSATAASSGSDLNGMAVKDAAEKLKKRIAKVVLAAFNHQAEENVLEQVSFKDDHIFCTKHPEKNMPFEEAVMKTYMKQVSLSATGFYRTPDIYFNRKLGRGKPFHYYAFGMAVSEVEIDILTGQLTNIRTDILHDAGKSLNQTLDIGQVRGGFIQGLGWVTTEECKWDKKGNLLNHSPDTYKIPGVRDIPADFRIALLQNCPNPNTIRQSKAVGEPPFMLALSVWLAIKDAISATQNHTVEPDFEIPATHEKIVLWIEGMKSEN